MSVPPPSSIVSPHASTKLLTVVGVVVFVATAVIAAPAAWLLSAAPADSRFRYSAVEGGFWRGTVSGVYIDSVNLGDVQYRLKPLTLLTGRFGAVLTARGGMAPGVYDVAVSRRGDIRINKARGVVDLAAVRRYRLFGAPVSGSLEFDIEALHLSPAGCRKAAGSVSTDVLDAPLARLGRASAPLAGDIRCEGEALAVDLSGETPDGDLNVAVRIAPDRSYEARLTLATDSAEVIRTFESIGFAAENGVLTFETFGDLTGPA